MIRIVIPSRRLKSVAVAAARLLAVVVVGFTLSANPQANPLEELPEIESAKEGMQLISRNAFGPLILAALAAKVRDGDGDAFERLFSTTVSDDDLLHAVSLTNNSGRVELGYTVSVNSDVKDVRNVFNVTKGDVVDYFASLDIGEYEGSEKLNEIQRKYKWKWVSGRFECEATYEYWERTQPYFYYQCTLYN